MKFLTALLLTALAGYAFPLFTPWWTFAVGSFLIGLLIPQRKGLNSFLAGFLGLLLLWGIWMMAVDSRNEHILSTRVAGILGVGSGFIVIVITALIGGLISGMTALAGWLLVPKRLW